MKVVVKLLINALAVYFTAFIMSNWISLDSFLTALIVALVLSVINAIIKPIIIIVTLPITLITLGLFTFIINAFMVVLVDYLVPGFEVKHFIAALVFSLVVSIVSAILNKLT